jgi:hypothetical protein
MECVILQVGGSVVDEWGRSLVLLHNYMVPPSRHLAAKDLAPNRELMQKILMAVK